MKAIDDAARALEKLSDKIGQDLFDGTIALKDKAQESQKLQKRYNHLLESRNIVQEHLFAAFDHLKVGKYKNAYSRIKEYRFRKKTLKILK